MAVGFSKNTRFVRESRNGGKVSTSVRLVEKEYESRSGDRKSYFEGAVQLGNGQWVWISVGGSLDNGHTLKDGRAYLPCKVSLTEGRSTSRRSNWS